MLLDGENKGLVSSETSDWDFTERSDLFESIGVDTRGYNAYRGVPYFERMPLSFNGRRYFAGRCIL